MSKLLDWVHERLPTRKRQLGLWTSEDQERYKHLESLILKREASSAEVKEYLTLEWARSMAKGRWPWG